MRWKQVTAFLFLFVESGSQGWRVYQAASFLSTILAPIIPFWEAMGVSGGISPLWVLAPVAGYIAVALSRKVWFLEREAESKLVILVGERGKFFQQSSISSGTQIKSEVYIGIKNISTSKTATGAEVTLANIVNTNDNQERYDLGRLLLFDDTRGAREDVNPGHTRYLKIAEIIQLRVGMDKHAPIVIGPFAVGGNIEIGNGPYRIKLRFSGANSPASEVYLLVGRVGGKFFFEALGGENVQREVSKP